MKLKSEILYKAKYMRFPPNEEYNEFNFGYTVVEETSECINGEIFVKGYSSASHTEFHQWFECPKCEGKSCNLENIFLQIS